MTVGTFYYMFSQHDVCWFNIRFDIPVHSTHRDPQYSMEEPEQTLFCVLFLDIYAYNSEKFSSDDTESCIFLNFHLSKPHENDYMARKRVFALL